MIVFLIVLAIIVCFLLVLVVLAQNSKGGGLAGNFGAGSAQLMGVKKTGDILEKLTWGFAITLVIISIAVNLIYKNAEPETGFSSPVIERANEGAGPALPSDGDGEQEESPATPPAPGAE